MKNAYSVEILQSGDHLMGEGFEVGGCKGYAWQREDSSQIMLHVVKDHIAGA